MRYTVAESPLGPILLAGDPVLCCVSFQKGRRRVVPGSDWVRDDANFAEAIHQLEEYFEGRRKHFDLPIAPKGTAFQKAVWRALRDVPYGTTTTYGALARKLRSSPRAVGAANGANPLPVFIPCHRVIGADGSLTGYGGGLRFKARLLAVENRQLKLFPIPV
jgi:methylated-DNA-[protein]-cysteine S-methyltransferase